ncbi:hypothetical protein [Paenibacillus sp. NEAU-GSW1]|uniref:hypothetical protein n=1 Tax=Paenibacillus sp. NEAU-GSW1 TaxID=2682486 RepID=UPI0015637A65|nr:hypothetical protein [Paenibacillus sp. NEAU-GSW1]
MDRKQQQSAKKAVFKAENGLKVECALPVAEEERPKTALYGWKTAAVGGKGGL